ncbi:PREDICTED: leucine-rich repeat-containing protein 72 isoform X4 [Calidris pugnax]|uniref:leucine-rich repeat-containing protein 72 isoform X4 n=1 Tax=Calidris pugnax TaxID=198806 RepID=UPI00071C845B|nr:PREDICTED: leucine-rich repeat-containing protein 72 isoform X4 [Calidris pugnax]
MGQAPGHLKISYVDLRVTPMSSVPSARLIVRGRGVIQMPECLSQRGVFETSARGLQLLDLRETALFWSKSWNADLFHNPLAEDRDYRLYVIHCLPSVQLLDRKLVTQKERESALLHCNHERSRLLHSIAFGKRVKTSLETTAGPSRCTQPARRLIMPSGCEFGNHTNRVPFENPDDAVLLRAMARSLMAFSSVEWNKVPTCRERRLENGAEEPQEKLTIQFR